MELSRSDVGLRTGMMTQVGARAVGRGMIQQWNRQVYVKMASTALIFTALQPVRPALHLPEKQHVGPGRVARGNYSNLLLFRQCASTDQSQGAVGTVLLETKECADGSIMYKFGSPDQKSLVSAAADPDSPLDEGVVQGHGQLISEASEPIGDQTGPSEEGPIVVVNGVQHSSSPISLSVGATTCEDVDSNCPIPDVNQKLASLDLGGVSRDSASTNGVAFPAEAPVKDPVSPETKESSDEVTEDGDRKEERSAYFKSGAAMIPHPFKKSGEDAFFIEGTRWIGVADGVGGWARDGIDAGLYARELMWNCAELARQDGKDSDPKTVLVKSFSKTKAKGSTTAVLASITDQTLNVVNMGDSGFIIIRDGVLLDRSIPMVRGFNFPYQIGSEGDDPLLAEVYTVQVKKGDVVVLASDGLFDNLFQNYIVDIVNRVVRAGFGPEVVAQKLANEAIEIGGTEHGTSPFGREAEKVGYKYSGGKLDDVTVVVSFIS